MKTRILLSILLVFACSLGSFAQDDSITEEVIEKAVEKATKLSNHLDVTLGFLPKNQPGAEYNALKLSVAYNNFILKRIGLYTSFEKGITTPHFSNIIGGTFTPWHPFYFFAGFDWFTPQHGVFYHGGFKEARKEIGIAFTPISNAVFRLGWSFNAGPSFGVGWKFDF